MPAGAGLHGLDALGRQDGVAQEEGGVLAGVDVVGDHRDGELLAQGPAEGGDGRGLAGADRSAESDAQGAAVCMASRDMVLPSPSRPMLTR